MTLLLVSATPFEIAPMLEQLHSEDWKSEGKLYRRGNLQVEVLLTGVGLPLAAYALGRRLAERSYHLVVQAGVAGALDRKLALGTVIEVVSDCFADLGVQEADGRFTPLTAMGLLAPDDSPFQEGRLWNAPEHARDFLPQVHGISVNKVHGEEQSIAALREQYPFAQVESMEGAAFFYATLQAGVPALQIRSVSNYVEKRQREKWQLETAITNLNGVLGELLNTLI